MGQLSTCWPSFLLGYISTFSFQTSLALCSCHLGKGLWSRKAKGYKITPTGQTNILFTLGSRAALDLGPGLIPLMGQGLWGHATGKARKKDNTHWEILHYLAQLWTFFFNSTTTSFTCWMLHITAGFYFTFPTLLFDTLAGFLMKPTFTVHLSFLVNAFSFCVTFIRWSMTKTRSTQMGTNGNVTFQLKRGIRRVLPITAWLSLWGYNYGEAYMGKKI